MGRRRAHRRGGRSRYIMSTPPSLATPPVATQPRAGLGERGIQLARFRDLALVPAILLLAVVGTLVDPVFLSASNIIDVLQQQTELSLLVLAESLILISGKFDLSLESTIGIAPALAVALVISRQNGGTTGKSLFALPPSVSYLGNTQWFGLPASLSICGVLYSAGIEFLGSYR